MFGLLNMYPSMPLSAQQYPGPQLSLDSFWQAQASAEGAELDSGFSLRHSRLPLRWQVAGGYATSNSPQTSIAGVFSGGVGWEVDLPWCRLVPEVDSVGQIGSSTPLTAGLQVLLASEWRLNAGHYLALAAQYRAFPGSNLSSTFSVLVGLRDEQTFILPFQINPRLEVPSYELTPENLPALGYSLVLASDDPEDIQSWQVEIRDSHQRLEHHWAGKGPPPPFSWQGPRDKENLADQKFQVTARVTDDLARDWPVAPETLTWIPVPRIQAKVSVPWALYTLGDDNSQPLPITIQMQHPGSLHRWWLEIRDPGGEVLHRWSGHTQPPAQLIWTTQQSLHEGLLAATEYQVILGWVDRRDRQGQTSTNFTTDVFVQKTAEGLKILIPTIHFPPDSANFTTSLGHELLVQNQRILRRLAEIFHKFNRYTIRIEGYANAVHYQDPQAAALEETQQLLPLSRQRAQSVAASLEELGVEKSRIHVVGKGGQDPLVPYSDERENWKNRRVEFYLVRP